MADTKVGGVYIEIQARMSSLEKDLRLLQEKMQQTDKSGASLAERFRRIEQSASLFGSKASELANKNAVLRQKMEELIAKGINPSNKGFAKLKQQYDENQKSIDGLNKKVDSSSNSFMKFTKVIAGSAIAYKILEIGKSALSAAANMEQQKMAFTSMLGSAEKAQKLLDQMQTFAASTPFQFDEIVEAGKKLVAFGEDSENVTKTLGKIGDVAAGLGIPLGELTEIYGKARVQQTLYAEDLNQLAGRGIPIFEELAKVMNVNASEVKKLGSEGKISFSMLEQVFGNLTSEGGKFAGLMDAQSQTLTGQWSNFNDQLDKTQLLLGDQILGNAKNVVAISSDLLAILNTALEKQNEASRSQLKWVGYLEEGRAWLEDYPDKLVAIIQKGGENAAIAKKYMDYLAGNIKLSENEVAVIQQKLQLNRDLLEIQSELTQAEKDRQDARHRDAAAFAAANKKKKDDKAAVNAKKADAVAYYTAIGDLEKASITSIEIEQKKQLDNAKLMYWRKLITKAEYEESVKKIELNYAKQIADYQEQQRQEAIYKEYEKFDKMQSAYEKYAGFVTGISGQINELASMYASNQTTRIEQEAQKRTDALNAEYENQIALIEASAASDSQKAEQKKALDEQLARDTKAIQDKAEKDKRKAQRESAKISKQLALFDTIVSTPAAAMQAFRSISMPLQPWTYPLAIGAAAATTALGLAKLKLIQDQPLPALAEGGIVPAIPGGRQITVAEGGNSEGVIPFNERGVDILAQAMEKAISKIGGGSGATNVYIDSELIYSNMYEASRRGAVKIDQRAIV